MNWKGIDTPLNQKRILEALDPDTQLQVSELSILMGLVIIDCYDRRIPREFMLEVLDLAMEGQRLIAGVGAEARMHMACELPQDEHVQKIFAGMMTASAREIHGIRMKIRSKLMELMECAGPEDSIS